MSRVKLMTVVEMTSSSYIIRSVLFFAALGVVLSGLSDAFNFCCFASWMADFVMPKIPLISTLLPCFSALS